VFTHAKYPRVAGILPAPYRNIRKISFQLKHIHTPQSNPNQIQNGKHRMTKTVEKILEKSKNLKVCSTWRRGIGENPGLAGIVA